jgi:ABC-type nitrate/sulfonate/bicarbonate transport system substrate-binding protein
MVTRLWLTVARRVLRSYKVPASTPRRSRALLARCMVAGGVTAFLVGATLPLQANASHPRAGFHPAAAEPGTSIPHSSMNFGMRPYANDAIYVIGMKLGWYKHVGIDIQPPPLGRKAQPNQAIPLLINHQLDAVALYPPDVIAAQDTVKNIRFIAVSDLFQGFAVLAAPGTHAKTVKDFLKQGMNFRQAMTKAMGQLRNQKFATAPVVDNRAFLALAFSLGGLDMSKDTQLVVTPDANALQLAKNGGVRFLSPTGAPFTAQLEQAGWIPIVTPLDILQHIPGGVTSKSETLVGMPGVAADADWATRNSNTVLRFVSVMFRIIAMEHSTPNKALSHELSYINAFAGTNLSLTGLRITIDELDPLLGWNDQKAVCDKPNSALYFKTWYRATVNSDVTSKALPSGNYPVQDLLWNCDVYHSLASYKAQSDRLLRQLSGRHLSASKRALVTQGRDMYRDFDFLDAYRYLKAAAK